MLVFDIETDGLLPELTRIHCVNMVDRETGARLRFNDQPELAGRPPDGTIEDALKLLQDADEIAGHNIVSFDIPALKKVYPWFEPRGTPRDTMVYSRLIWTDLKDIDFRAIAKRRRPPEWETGCRFGERMGSCTGRHSLAAWGYRLGDYKGDYSGDWTAFNPEMDDYCAQDVEVTVKLLEKIEAEGYDPAALDLETEVAEIISLQERQGFLFDVEAAERLAAEMAAEMADLDARLRQAFPPWLAPVIERGRVVEKTPTRAVTLRGVTTDETPVKVRIEKGHAYCPVKLVEFEPSSRDKIANRLKKLFGWVPQEFTDGGKPKVDETTLDALEYPEAALLRDYLTLAKRLGFLATGDNALLKMVGPDGRIHGKVNSNGAVTGRMTHFSPNLAQVPKVLVDGDGKPIRGLKGGYGFELRSLFIVPKGKRLVGVDAEGLELRMLAHYMARYDNGAYVETVVNGKKSDGTDVHTVNRKLVGLNSRDNAKTWKYAYLYGAGDWKLGFTAYSDLDDAARLAFNQKHGQGENRDKALSRLGRSGRTRIEKGLPALGQLQEAVQKKAKTGFLRSLDGRKLRVRGMHSALNTLLQGGGAIVMKKALVIAYREFLARGWEHGREFAFVANVHDEFQIEAEESLAEEIGAIAADAIRQAGEAFNLRCPLSGSKDIGLRWSDTH